MASFTRLIRFEANDSNVCFADPGKELQDLPAADTELSAFGSFEDLLTKFGAKTVSFRKLLAPLLRQDLPIYCFGLNYKSRAAEANLQLSKDPPLWTKPAAALADPGQDIVMNGYCAKSMPDYEGELVFVTSRTCKDLTEREAAEAILGYTIGNDLSCCLFQFPGQGGGQFFYAKAFDNFASIGPTLISRAAFSMGKSMTTKVDGEIRQQTNFEGDMVFRPAQVLSYMSQGTTIPAFTAVMTGTPAGVGWFMKPERFLEDGNVVEVCLARIGVLKNKIVFE